MDKELYDEDPVYYCKRCLSLKVKEMPFISSQDYCEDCGAVDIGTTTIEEWKEKILFILVSVIFTETYFPLSVPEPSRLLSTPISST